MRDRLVVAARLMETLAAARVDAMSDAFEMAGMPAVFFNRNARVTKANAAATKLFGPDLKIVEGRLIGRYHDDTVRIQKRMQAILTSAWLDPANARPITIKRLEKRPLLVRIQRLGDNLMDVFGASVGVCLIEDLEPVGLSDVSAIGQSYGLTSRQAEIALMLAQGKRLREIAEEMCITYQTARTHLRTIFEKTATNRQSELVAILSRSWKVT